MMNTKVAIWKRKLAKNKRKQQEEVWDALTKDHSKPFVHDNDIDSLYPWQMDILKGRPMGAVGEITIFAGKTGSGKTMFDIETLNEKF